ncbi:putative methyl-accepting chemotaxis protein [Desulforapulum autotrophicum HRM2]|uniref:Methyl-accepting chemotaxis protein n=1 Tax=Desulforapulum autotrophicum (strain ATCC 43914 / DSM 3382 / VKM B-1955 / HRM2) TaxID=177437 RepID=C0QKF2_DESAH|nr:phosphate/phosphite/phosphonate ABC transporter substrate-binding protein [Desulforapulum autotrophicum]ACN14023.1 putative methyl-accepting chemotaxis protein [Desulforapulum autotrophicum HRM2]
MKKINVSLCFLLCWIFISPANCIAGDKYKLSMLPRYYPKKIKEMIVPLAEYLSKEIGATITAVLTKDFTEYENQLKNGEIEIGFENPLVYTKVSQKHEVLAMAIQEKGGNQFRGIIITRPDSNIQLFSDLRHKKIIIVGKTSAGGFLSQKLSLAKNGILVEKDCDIEEAANNKQENVIISVSIGDADAGFIRESALHIADQYIQPGSVVVMTPCEWLPNWAISVNRAMPGPVKAAIKSAILALDKNSPVLKAMHIAGFKSAVDSEYDIIRNIL